MPAANPGRCLCTSSAPASSRSSPGSSCTSPSPPTRAPPPDEGFPASIHSHHPDARPGQTTVDTRRPRMTLLLPDRLDTDISLTLPTLLRRRALEQPDHVFIRTVDGDDVTYLGLETRVQEWMRALTAAGVERGDRLVTLLPPSSDATAVWMAAARIGAIETPVNTALRGSLLSYVLSDADPRCIIASPRFSVVLRDALHGSPAAPPVYLVDGASESSDARTGFSRADFGAEVAVDDRDPLPHEIATIVYTSGTSGRSKGVLVPWAQEYATARWLMPVDGRQGDVWYSPWAMYHVSGKVGVYSSALLNGQLIIRDGFSSSQFWNDIREYGVTSTMLVASTVSYLVQQPPTTSDGDHTLRNVCAAPLPADTAAFQERFGVRVSTLFNMTEVASPIATGWSDAPQGSCGRAREGVDARIVDEFGHEVPVGGVGELVLRMSAPHEIMAGYWRAPAATVETWSDLWFHTGDAARCDGDGWFYFVDRLKDTIRRGGENISSVELESIVAEHPLVRECAAVGIPNTHGDRDVVLFIVGEPSADAAKIAEDLDERLPRFMRPSRICLVEELPKTHTARVKKEELRRSDLAVAWSRPDRAPTGSLFAQESI
ncbi:AMP-binding protein [Leucobacter chromiisoli]|uniref:AMP-binding protein n=1 Tax=Leucobacter chromiisoli TaxID=2796471 RepID=UPI001F2CBEF5|nr:AMP-binding protein [Leucobacter chromiisoli]